MEEATSIINCEISAEVHQAARLYAVQQKVTLRGIVEKGMKLWLTQQGVAFPLPESTRLQSLVSEAVSTAGAPAVEAHLRGFLEAEAARAGAEAQAA